VIRPLLRTTGPAVSELELMSIVPPLTTSELLSLSTLLAPRSTVPPEIVVLPV
jgi:hypothetical protein